MRCSDGDNPMDCGADIFKGIESFGHEETNHCTLSGGGPPVGDVIGVGVQQDDADLPFVGQVMVVVAPPVKEDKQPIAVSNIFLRRRKSIMYGGS